MRRVRSGRRPPEGPWTRRGTTSSSYCSAPSRWPRDRVVEIGSAKQRALLAALLLRRNHVVPVESLVEDLWGGSPPPTVGGTLQSLVSRLRRAFGAPGPDGPRLRSRDGGYVLEAAAAHVDAVRFDGLVAAGRRALADGNAAAAADALLEGLGLWRGAALGDLADRPFARAEAQRLEEARLAAVEDLGDALLNLGRPQDALDRLEAHLLEHPLRERPWGQLMLALYRLGRQADALRAFRRVRRVLADELSVEPMPQLCRLAERILHQDPDLAVPTEPTARRTGDIVVFLAIDIVDTAADVHLARLDAVLPEAVDAGDGEVVARTDEGVRVAFPTVPAAVAAAVALHRGLHVTTAAGPPPPGVRMAVHAGAAQRHDGRWSGPTLDRTARMLAAAGAGQIVCSHAAAELGRDDLPADTVLVDLREHRPIDRARPERVFHLAHPDLPTVAAPTAGQHNLPIPLTSFVGRKRELDEVVSLVADSRLLTLAGPGGSGKTRLALHAAGCVLGRYRDGVWLVELAPVRDPDLVVDEVVTALGLLPGGLARPDEPLERGLSDHLRPRRLLLVLDNCEHVVETAARLTQSVLSRCPDVTVLTTSREVLGVPGEVVFRVPPLSLPADDEVGLAELARSDAVALFCERARMARPGFVVSEANAAAVARICRRLDGIPLGLELAAGKIRVLGADQLAERLDHRFLLLTGGARTAVPRHQTLRAAMDWSHSLLPPPERAVLRRLSVFRGTFPLDAAEGVVFDQPASGVAGFDVLGLLTRLVDKSMLYVVDDGREVRYGLLETHRVRRAQARRGRRGGPGAHPAPRPLPRPRRRVGGGVGLLELVAVAAAPRRRPRRLRGRAGVVARTGRRRRVAAPRCRALAVLVLGGDAWLAAVARRGGGALPDARPRACGGAGRTRVAAAAVRRGARTVRGAVRGGPARRPRPARRPVGRPGRLLPRPCPDL